MTLSARRNCGWNEVAASEWSEETGENDQTTPLIRAGHRYFLPETTFAPVSGPRLSKLFLSKFQSCARFYIFRAKFQVVHSGPVASGCSCQKSCLPFLVKESKAQTAPLFQLLCISYISYCMMASLCCLSRTNSGVSRVGVQQTQRDEENLALKHL